METLNGQQAAVEDPGVSLADVVETQHHEWTFLSNHAHVVICLAQNPEVRVRDVALRVGITERAVQRIIADLEEAGIITRVRDGRRNHYLIHGHRPLRHPVESHRTVGDLIRMVFPNALQPHDSQVATPSSREEGGNTDATAG
ncbi:MAG: winged helix-turn-helix domain-containing protein [Chloroherpetonaceae bacterium]|nr:winged helix-turn-helix domain-containing protein [Chthonomonadaceae bacterium]MDW8208068.1 winged helix-turn-helix domain-containing protein [Chloroherpetonaceae bacterium]